MRAATRLKHKGYTYPMTLAELMASIRSPAASCCNLRSRRACTPLNPFVNRYDFDLPPSLSSSNFIDAKILNLFISVERGVLGFWG